MFFMIGALLGVVAGMVRTVVPSLGNWGMAISLGMAGLSVDLGIGFLLGESCIGGLGSIVGGAYSPNLSNPMIADIAILDKKEVAEEAASLYTYWKVLSCIGFSILIFFGANSLKIDVWPWSKYFIFLFIIPSALKKVGLKALFPYIGVMGMSVMAALILIRNGTPNAIYLFFMGVFVLGGSLAGFKPMPRQKKIKQYTADYRWAFLTGAMSSILIGVPSSLLLDLEGNTSDEALYKENAVASGVSEGMGISLFMVGFGSRDAVSSTLALWMNDVGKWQALACLGLVVVLTLWYYCNFVDGLIRLFEKTKIKSNGLIVITLGITSTMIIGNLPTLCILSCIGFCIWKVMKVHKIDASSLSLVISLIACLVIG